MLNATGEEITDPTHIGVLNPFRYRSYYFDTETGLYFLKTRYYDPEIGRFISIDDISYLDPEIINGLNLYAYCGNNPVMGYDPNGTWDWSRFWKTLLGVVVCVGLFVATTTAVLLSGGTLLIPALVGFAVGASTSLIGQGIGNLASGRNFFDGISLGSVLMGGLTGAAFATGIGGLWGSVLIGAAGNMGTAAFENKSWANIGLSAVVGGVSAGLSYGVGKLVSNAVFKNNDIGFRDLYEAGILDSNKVSLAFAKVVFHSLRGSYTSFFPSISVGVSRGIMKF